MSTDADLNRFDELSKDLPSVPRTVKYLMRDRTGNAEATLKKSNMWGFQIKSRDERGDNLIETFGRTHHGLHLSAMGFELLQVDQQAGGFSGDGYHNPEQLHDKFKALVREHPDQAAIVDLTATYNMPKTIEGRNLYALKISDNVKVDESEPNILLVSNHHARELVTPELALDFATRLLEGQKRAAMMESGELELGESEKEDVIGTKKIVDNNQVYIQWTMNPDGLNTVWTTDAWRRTNGRNVDLNRNYPIGWAASCGGSTDTDGETYRGDEPFSEPETKTMRAFQEDRNFAKLMDFHSYARQVRTNYGSCAKLPGGIDQKFESIRNGIADGMEYQHSRSCCMGGDIHYAYNRHGSLAYLVETATAFQPPAAEKDAELVRVWPGVKKFLSLPIASEGKITDAATGEPLQAKIELPEFDFSLKEKNQSNKRGHFHLWLPEGEHKVVVTAEGKPPKTVTVKASDSGAINNIQI